MLIFKTKTFTKNAASEGLTDEALKKAIAEIEQGLVNAVLGGNLIKKRVAVGSRGKSGGLRTIMAYKTLMALSFASMYLQKMRRKTLMTVNSRR
jgi:hypothetical protein